MPVDSAAGSAARRRAVLKDTRENRGDRMARALIMSVECTGGFASEVASRAPQAFPD